MLKKLLSILAMTAVAACVANDPVDAGDDGDGCAGGAAGSTGASSGGTRACVADEDCPGPENYCQSRACDNGVCGFTFRPAGDSEIDLVRGDCRLRVCDGAGNFVLTLVNDPHNDGNDCTKDFCVEGENVHAPVDPGLQCVLRLDDRLAIGSCDNTGTCTSGQ